MWLQKGAQVTLVPERMPETIARLLGDGWVEVADPRVVPMRDEPAPDAQPSAASVASPPADRVARYQPPVRKKGRR